MRDSAEAQRARACIELARDMLVAALREIDSEDPDFRRVWAECANAQAYVNDAAETVHRIAWPNLRGEG